MSARSNIGLLALLFLLGGVIFLVLGFFELRSAGHSSAALPAALACIMLSLVSSTAFRAFGEVEARLKAVEARLAKCERSTAAN